MIKQEYIKLIKRGWPESHLGAGYPAALAAVPEHLREGLDAYIKTGWPTGSFLEAVISNDLADAMGRGDEVSVRHVYELVIVLRSFAPPMCWRSRKAYQTWLELHALAREQEAEARR